MSVHPRPALTPRQALPQDDRFSRGRRPRVEKAKEDAPTQAERSSATQKRILDAAEQEFAVRGFAGARLREISNQAQAQPALIHHYFGDKEGLYQAVIKRALDQMSTAGWKVLESENNLGGYLGGFVDLLIDFYESNQNLLAIVRNEAHDESGVFGSIKPILEAVLGIVEMLQAQGEVRDDFTPREVLLACISLILYPIVDAPLIRAVLPDPDQDSSKDRRKKVVTELLVRAIQPKPIPRAEPSQRALPPPPEKPEARPVLPTSTKEEKAPTKRASSGKKKTTEASR